MSLPDRGEFDALSPALRAASTCAACGGPLACGAGTGECWCQSVTVPDAVRADLSARYESCLCRACLEREAAANPSI
jgi:Cysteine-rich CWC